MTGNVLLAARMHADGLKQHELADALNKRIASFTGKPGTLQDRHVRNWLTGKTRWPQGRQRRALEEEFGCSAVELGFTKPAPRPSAPAPPAPTEDPVRRRTFASTATGLVAAAALPPAPTTSALRVGMSDADRLEGAFAQLVSSDNTHGGTISLETRALAFAHHANELQAVGSASQRVRSRLYYLGAAFTGTALWAAVDAHEPERAQRHLERAMRLAGMSGNSEMQLRLWGHAALLSYQLQHHPDALAAAQAGRASAACRRDPLLRSLAAARLAGIQAGTGERTAAMRNLDHAIDAFDRAEPSIPRPTWVGFYDRAELDGLSALIMARLGQHDQSEAYLHRTLARLRPEYLRNRTYYGAHLALAQLRQGDVELACMTATSVLPDDASDSLTGRTGKLLHTFNHELTRTAPGAQAASQWTDEYTSRKGRPL
ncbi:Tat pathway signal protein [Streptomyces sp. NBC_01465]|uniref:Tat pathway signal protein n=1 Tax=Streptomyces sp. NBC_01465 TaxID=2903878 RepID=UPI002E2FE90A|nr:Tat pathway signal protein [Streptomyces sp. NBC_01465]